MQQLQSDRQSSRQAPQDAVVQRQYEADRAQRQYDRVEPENRLIAATLEKRWNEAVLRLNEAPSAIDRGESLKTAIPACIQFRRCDIHPLRTVTKLAT